MVRDTVRHYGKCCGNCDLRDECPAGADPMGSCESWTETRPDGRGSRIIFVSIALWLLIAGVILALASVLR